MQYARVASRVSRDRRNPELSWSHHRAVAPLEPSQQIEWLDRAQEKGWTKGELEDAIKLAIKGEVVRQPKHSYVVEVVASAAERVWQNAVQSASDPDVFFISREVLEDLASALGEEL